jgi:hypothetical protein
VADRDGGGVILGRLKALQFIKPENLDIPQHFNNEKCWQVRPRTRRTRASRGPALLHRTHTHGEGCVAAMARGFCC